MGHTTRAKNEDSILSTRGGCEFLLKLLRTLVGAAYLGIFDGFSTVTIKEPAVRFIHEVVTEWKQQNLELPQVCSTPATEEMPWSLLVSKIPDH